MSRGSYEDWKELVRRQNANGSDGARSPLNDSEQAYWERMEEASGLTFRARHAKEMRARLGRSAPAGAVYCRICKGPHVYKHGRP